MYTNAQTQEELDIAKVTNQIDGYVDSNRSYEDEIKRLNDRITELENLNSYSATEKVIGTWIDGKPLYRFNYIFNKTSIGETEITFSTIGLTDYNNFDKIIKMECATIGSSNNFCAGTYYMNDKDYLGCYIKQDKKSVIIRSGENWPKVPYEVRFTIEYTKTTD